MFTMEFWAAFALIAVVSYLLGSVNFALLISKGFAGDDIRRHGSGNAGMTNVLRTYGAKPAIATAAGDFLKALIAILISRFIFRRMDVTLIDAGYISGLFVLIGHLFPVYFRFKGGKGVIVTLGVIFVTNPLAFLIIMVIFIPIVVISKMVALASVLGALVYPFLIWLLQYLWGEEPLYNTICAATFSVIVLITHRDNIKRILSGTENKLGKKK